MAVTGNVVAITGIDTGAGKTVATGLLARALMRGGVRVMTQKLVETGASGMSLDILRHREIMGIAPQDEDRDGTTCPYVFAYPASPHLAAAREERRIDPAVIRSATRRLCGMYDLVLLEGAGGLLVPLDGETLIADYLRTLDCPVVLVSGSRLGSINHTLLSIETCRARGLRLGGVLYNRHGSTDDIMAEDTREVILRHLRACGCDCPLVDLPDLAGGDGISYEEACALTGRRPV